MVIYFLIVPAMLSPDWCLSWYDDGPGKRASFKNGLLLDCAKAQNGDVIYSNIPKLRPVASATLDIACLIYLSSFRFFKLTWSAAPTRKRIIQNWIFVIVVVICITDSVVSVFSFEYPWLNNLLRPVVVILFFSSIRTNLMLVWHDFQDSFIILISIFIFILFFSALGLFIFQGSFTGTTEFNSINESYFQLVMLLTDTNFPDVMLLSYYDSTWYTIFFIIFVVSGVFFLLNVLLAVIFDNYKRRIELNSVQRIGNRRQHVEKIYNRFDTEGKGYLTISQARKFFAVTLDLNYKLKSHQKIFRKTLKHLDVEELKEIRKERIMTYFALGGFLVLEELDRE